MQSYQSLGGGGGGCVDVATSSCVADYCCSTASEMLTSRSYSFPTALLPPAHAADGNFTFNMTTPVAPLKRQRVPYSLLWL